jgi:hypothetical protein
MRLTKTLAAMAVICGGSSAARATVLYNGAAGTAPESQGWLTYDSLPAGATHGTSGSITTVDTTASPLIGAGYSNYLPTSTSTAALVNPLFPTLDSTKGFDLDFTAELTSESHSSNDRAGLDVILLDQNHVGVELGFWTTQVWTQNAGFTHGEGTTNFNAAAGFYNYDLHIANGDYTLYANGSAILTGATRDYSGSVAFPYDLPDYVFLGDDTTAAEGAFEFSGISVVPEPAGITLVAAGLMAGIRRRRS